MCLFKKSCNKFPLRLNVYGNRMGQTNTRPIQSKKMQYKYFQLGLECFFSLLCSPINLCDYAHSSFHVIRTVSGGRVTEPITPCSMGQSYPYYNSVPLSILMFPIYLSYTFAFGNSLLDSCIRVSVPVLY